MWNSVARLGYRCSPLMPQKNGVPIPIKGLHMHIVWVSRTELGQIASALTHSVNKLCGYAAT